MQQDQQVRSSKSARIPKLPVPARVPPGSNHFANLLGKAPSLDNGDLTTISEVVESLDQWPTTCLMLTYI